MARKGICRLGRKRHVLEVARYAVHNGSPRGDVDLEVRCFDVGRARLDELDELGDGARAVSVVVHIPDPGGHLEAARHFLDRQAVLGLLADRGEERAGPQPQAFQNIDKL